MSTRSAVGTIDSTGTFRGRYVHSDGYPTSRGPVLTQLIARRDGDLPGLIKIVTEDCYGWSYLDPTYVSDTAYLGDRGQQVEGVGLAYTTAQGQSGPSEWTRGQLGFGGDSGWTEWGYFFTTPKATPQRNGKVAETLDPAVSNLVVVVFANDVALPVVTIPVRDLHKVTQEGWALVEREGDRLRNGDTSAIDLTGVSPLALPAPTAV